MSRRAGLHGEREHWDHSRIAAPEPASPPSMYGVAVTAALR